MEWHNPCLEANDQIRYSKHKLEQSNIERAYAYSPPAIDKQRSQFAPEYDHHLDISALLARRWKAERYEIRALYKRIEDSSAAGHSVGSASEEGPRPSIGTPPDDFIVEQFNPPQPLDVRLAECFCINAPELPVTIEQPSPEDMKQHRAMLVAEEIAERRRRKIVRKVKHIRRAVKRREGAKRGSLWRMRMVKSRMIRTRRVALRTAQVDQRTSTPDNFA
ncbi:hypothetical protein C8Q76DRAFT_791098 [Earliella scabrosa]|nr:hypothetical protein C8Q76DRAFT_791098 [Earliella scabrosa]